LPRILKEMLKKKGIPDSGQKCFVIDDAGLIKQEIR
jgi:hypothetical protein